MQVAACSTLCKIREIHCERYYDDWTEAFCDVELSHSHLQCTHTEDSAVENSNALTCHFSQD